MYSFSVKVRSHTYIWGGYEIAASLNSPLILTIRVEDVGEPVVLGITRVNPRRNIRLGRLLAGETYSIPLNDISGVYAQCQFDTNVQCYITESVTDSSRLAGVAGL